MLPCLGITANVVNRRLSSCLTASKAFCSTSISRAVADPAYPASRFSGGVFRAIVLRIGSCASGFSADVLWSSLGVILPGVFPVMSGAPARAYASATTWEQKRRVGSSLDPKGHFDLKAARFPYFLCARLRALIAATRAACGFECRNTTQSEGFVIVTRAKLITRTPCAPTASKNSVGPRKIKACEYLLQSATRISHDIKCGPRSNTTSPGRSFSRSNIHTGLVALGIDRALAFRLGFLLLQVRICVITIASCLPPKTRI